MRPAGRGELDSLYFDYPTFDAPARDGLALETPVAIVGAGPVGMVTALTLARYGQRCVLLDDKATVNDGSRAICIARTSYQVLEMLGGVEPFLDKALPYLSGRTFFRGKQILEFKNPDSAQERYRPMYNLQQQYIELFLHDAVARNPLIDMRWRSECVGVRDVADGVVLDVEDPFGQYELHALWLIAADGSRSPLRAMRGKRLRGDNHEGRYVIADIQIRREENAERRALFDPDRRPGSTVLVHQQPDDIWRVDYQLRDDEDEAEALKEANIRIAIQQVLDECGFQEPWTLEWWSIYSANTLALDDYRDGRVFFVGDAAHIVPIFGVRGFNNGVLDGHNLGWKLAYVLSGRAQPALLNSYTPERRGATLDVFEKSSRSAQFMTPRSRGHQVLRDAALSLALDHPFAGQFANPRNMTPYAYAESPLTRPDEAAWDAGPRPGDSVPDAKLDDGFLLDRLGPHFTVLSFGEGPASSDLVTVLEQPTDGPAAARYGASPGAAYLIRPDRFVAARWRDVDATKVQAEIDLILRGGRR